MREKPKRSSTTGSIKGPATVKLPQLPNHMPSSKPGESAVAAAKKAEAAAAALQERLDSNV